MNVNSDPADYTVDEVNEYLANHPENADTVLAKERDGKARVGILGESADAGSAEVTGGRTVAPDGLPEGVEPVMSVQEATNLAASNDGGEFTALSHEEAQDLGYFGTSVGAVYTGRLDDGLSLPAQGVGSDSGQNVQPVQHPDDES